MKRHGFSEIENSRIHIYMETHMAKESRWYRLIFLAVRRLRLKGLKFKGSLEPLRLDHVKEGEEGRKISEKINSGKKLELFNKLTTVPLRQKAKEWELVKGGYWNDGAKEAVADFPLKSPSLLLGEQVTGRDNAAQLPCSWMCPQDEVLLTDRISCSDA